MTYVILGSCVNDAACVPVCPVDCIHPRPDEPDFLKAEMLYINPDVCVNCGACADACPISAIVPDLSTTDHRIYAEINASFFRGESE